MTVIENLNPRAQYNGPLSIDDELPITFPYTNPEDVQCILGETNLQYNIDYTIFEQTLTLKKDVAEDQTITIYRTTPLDQQAEFPQNNKFNSAKMNEALDKICMQQQEQEEVIARCMKVPISTMNFDGSIPVPKASRALKINTDATGFEMSEFDPDLALITTEEFKNQAQQAAIDALSSQTAAANSELESSRQAGIATEQAGIATEQAENITNTAEDALENISTAKDDAVQTITTTKNSAISQITEEAQTQTNNIERTGFYMRDDKLYFINSEGKEQKFNPGSAYVGQTIFSLLPLNEAGLHLLDGTVLDGNGIYKDFVDYIKGLDLTANCFTTETDWQASVSNYGVCGKFVYNSNANTVRLPKVTGILEGTIDANALGDLVEAGLPAHTHTRGTMNITGSFDNSGLAYEADAPTGAFYTKATSQPSNQNRDNVGYTYGFEASRSWTGSTSTPNYTADINTISTVQPQTIKGYYYIVVANKAKTSLQVDIDNISSDLNGKADTDLNNVTDTAKVMISGYSLPSNKFISLSLGTSGTTYTAPANGWITLRKIANSDGSAGAKYCDIYNRTSAIAAHNNGAYSFQLICTIPVLKGDTIQINYNATGETILFRFIYAEGSK